jgi:hypothetical protein
LIDTESFRSWLVMAGGVQAVVVGVARANTVDADVRPDRGLGPTLKYRVPGSTIRISGSFLVNENQCGVMRRNLGLWIGGGLHPT